jgi:5-methyltetrahydropteroyltriglutamate--homocysteine methyltransferase
MRSSVSALSLLYPQGGIPGYSREEYLETLLAEQENEIRRCLQKGAHVVQIDFTEGRLSIKLDHVKARIDENVASYSALNAAP